MLKQITKMRKKLLILLPVLILAPVAAHAYGGGLWNLFYIVMNLLNKVVALLIALAVVFFMIGVVKFIASADDEDKRISGKKMMLWGIIGLFVLVSFWGFVAILVNTFNLDDRVPFIPYFVGGWGGGAANNYSNGNNGGSGGTTNGINYNPAGGKDAWSYNGESAFPSGDSNGQSNYGPRVGSDSKPNYEPSDYTKNEWQQ